MQRRHFFEWMGGLAAGAATQAPAGAKPRQAVPAKRIVVVGAGLAGLAAAQQLQALGHAVVVLEARARIGGRIWTSTQWPDAPLDLGASWIHGLRGNPLTELARLAQAALLITRYDSSITYGTQGKPLHPTQLRRLDALHQQVSRALRKAQGAEQDRSVRAVVDALQPDSADTAEFRRMVNFIVNGTIEHEYAGSAQQLSAHWYDSARSFGGDDALLAQGFGQIADHLAQGLAIETGRVVQAVHWGQTPVRVRTQSEEYLADQVLLTLPLGVLQAGSVRMVPELPAPKQTAIAQLGMGVLNKCYLRFEKAFWPHGVDWLEYIAQRPGEWTEWVSFQQAARLPVLLGFNAAERGHAIERWTDAQMVDSAMQTLRVLFGAKLPAPLDYQITRWAADPFALGSYSFNALGSTPQHRQELARPIEARLFFAGEATEVNYFGTAHGAYLSGLRAAAELAAQ